MSENFCDEVRTLLSNCTCNPPATQAQCSELADVLGVQLPNDFERFLQIMNGAEGPVGNHAYLALMDVDSIPDANKDLGLRPVEPGDDPRSDGSGGLERCVRRRERRAR